MANVRADLKEDIANVEVRLNDKIHTEVSELRKAADRDFRILFGALIALGLGLSGLMAKGFHWL
ncbi:hypothetical protein RL73_02495 [Liberibacter crescens]|nr:hypothetical protein RL73_02495 [Liberibacter crescens]